MRLVAEFLFILFSTRQLLVVLNINFTRGCCICLEQFARVSSGIVITASFRSCLQNELFVRSYSCSECKNVSFHWLVRDLTVTVTCPCSLKPKFHYADFAWTCPDLIPLERHKRVCPDLSRTLSQTSRHVKIVFVRDFHDLCPRHSPRGNFGESRHNGIWALCHFEVHSFIVGVILIIMSQLVVCLCVIITQWWSVWLWRRYDDVIERCSLKHDINVLPAADETEVYSDR